jgi:hypothetical protein
MRYCLCGLAGLALLTIASPAFAEMQSFTLGGHQFHFDIPPGYAEDKELSAETKKFLRRLRMFLLFYVRYETMNETFDRLKDNPRWKSEYLFDGRVVSDSYLSRQRMCFGCCVYNFVFWEMRYFG